MPAKRKGITNMKSLRKIQITAASTLVSLSLYGCNQQAPTTTAPQATQEPVTQSTPQMTPPASTNNLPVPTTDSSATSTNNPLSPTGISTPTVTNRSEEHTSELQSLT